MARRGINKVIILGSLGNDPECRYLPNGDAVTNFSVATSETWKDKSSGQDQERVEWHRCVAFKKAGEILAEYLRKGSKIYIEGALRTRKWTDQAGNDRYSTEIIVDQFELLTPKSADSAPAQPSSGQNERNAQYAQGPAPGAADYEDDIPFHPIVMFY
jgi:single-strand DNA-binding protein